MAINKKIRFEIFKRDGFLCRYCGKVPPEVILEIDHIIPVSEKGTDDINNLITSCFNCNRGKGKIALNILPTSLTENIEIIKERQTQTRKYYRLLEQIEQVKQKNIEEIGYYFFNLLAEDDKDKYHYVFSGNWKTSINTFLKSFNKYEIVEAIDIAFSRLQRKHSKVKEENLFKYMCGILHNWRKEKNGVD